MDTCTLRHIINDMQAGQTDGQDKAGAIVDMFRTFNLEFEVQEIRDGRTALQILLRPKTTVRMKKLREFEDDICFALGVKEVQIEAPIRGTTLIGISLPKEKIEPLHWKDLLESQANEASKKGLGVPIGKDEANSDVVTDMRLQGHIIVTGDTGTGKSMLLHGIICSLISRHSPVRLRLILDDAKRVEFGYHYNETPHMLTPAFTDTRKSILALKWLNKEMERRFAVLEEKGCLTIEEYHKKCVDPILDGEAIEGETPEAMPYILMIFDEVADLMMQYPREAETAIVPLLQLSRGVGIHLILTTSRPSAKVLPSVIRANIPSRIAFHVSSNPASRICIDSSDCQHLRKQGDALCMLYSEDKEFVRLRVQTPQITDEEIQPIVAAVKEIYREDASIMSSAAQVDTPWSTRAGDFEEDDQSEEDNLYGEAAQIVREAGKASTSFLQRKLGVGYSRAAKLMHLLELGGVVGPADGARPRSVLYTGEK